MTAPEQLVLIQANKQVLETYLDKLGKPDFSIDHLPRLNKLLCGFGRKKMVCVTARTSEGKSAFCLDLAYQFSKRYKVLYMSLEMPTEIAMFRLLCNSQEIQNTEFYWGNKNLYRDRIEKYFEELKESKLIICENIGRTWQEIAETMESFAEDKPDIIFLDWAGQIKTGQNKRSDIDDYIKRFRELAVEHNLCVCVVQQINRENIKEGGEPTMQGIKESSYFEESSDVVLVLSYAYKRNSNKDINEFLVSVAKNRDGMTAFVKLHFEPSMYKFKEIEPETVTNLMDVQKIAEQFKGTVHEERHAYND